VLTRRDWNVWLAERAGRVAGFQLYASTTPSDSDLMTPDGCIELKLGATREDERGCGAGRLLTEHGLAWAAGEGYTTCIADWRVTNLLASRFWPRRDFRPVAYRLHRRIDERIVWANTRGDEIAGMLDG
jgi:GNAT superfamily N-acetyltransferase